MMISSGEHPMGEGHHGDLLRGNTPMGEEEQCDGNYGYKGSTHASIEQYLLVQVREITSNDLEG